MTGGLIKGSWDHSKSLVLVIFVILIVLDAPNLKAFCEYQNSELLFLY